MHSRGAHFLALLTPLVVTLGLAAASSATAPGKNGKIAFRRYLDADHTQSALFTANADVSGVRQITHPPRGVLDVEPDWSPNGKQIVFQRVVRTVADRRARRRRSMSSAATGLG